MTPTECYLERFDASRNMARYYRISISLTLFGEWVMCREWGRVGRNGQRLEHVCTTRDEAQKLLEARKVERMKRGYR